MFPTIADGLRDEAHPLDARRDRVGNLDLLLVVVDVAPEQLAVGLDESGDDHEFIAAIADLNELRHGN
jgi:hypothetical protein